MKRTPLYAKHVELGAKLVDFAGYQMPIQYTGIIQEHNAVRHSAGLFDVSHMGEFIITGDGAEVYEPGWWNLVDTRDLKSLGH